MAKVRTAVFNGRVYVIDMPGSIDGLCDTFKLNSRSITIATPPGTKRELVTIIHECLHASNWRASEEKVDTTSTEIGRLLWRLGYRKVK